MEDKQEQPEPKPRPLVLQATDGDQRDHIEVTLNKSNGLIHVVSTIDSLKQVEKTTLKLAPLVGITIPRYVG